MAIKAYADKLLNDHGEVGPRTSVSREEVIGSFTMSDGTGKKVRIVDTMWIDPKKMAFENQVRNGTGVGTALAVMAILSFIACVGVCAGTSTPLSSLSLRCWAFPVINGACAVGAFAIATVNHQLKRHYLNKRLKGSGLINYLTAIQKHAEYNSGQSSRYEEISRQLTEMPSKV